MSNTETTTTGPEAKTYYPIIPLELKTLLDTAQNRTSKQEGGRRVARIRCSIKQLWFYAYKAKEMTGKGFACTGSHGRNIPTGIPLGQWPDGSPFAAEARYNAIDGPCWLEYTEALTID